MQKEEYIKFFEDAINYCRENQGNRELLPRPLELHYFRNFNSDEKTPQEIKGLVSRVVDDLVREGKVRELSHEERPKELEWCPYGFFEILGG